MHISKPLRLIIVTSLNLPLDLCEGLQLALADPEQAD